RPGHFHAAGRGNGRLRQPQPGDGVLRCDLRICPPRLQVCRQSLSGRHAGRSAAADSPHLLLRDQYIPRRDGSVDEDVPRSDAASDCAGCRWCGENPRSVRPASVRNRAGLPAQEFRCRLTGRGGATTQVACCPWIFRTQNTTPPQTATGITNRFTMGIDVISITTEPNPITAMRLSRISCSTSSKDLPLLSAGTSRYCRARIQAPNRNQITGTTAFTTGTK